MLNLTVKSRKPTSHTERYTRPYALVEEPYLAKLSGPGLRAFLVVLSYGIEDSVVYGVPQATMAEMAGLSPRALKRGIRLAVEAGALSTHKRHRCPSTYQRLLTGKANRHARIPVDVVRRMKNLRPREIRVLTAMYLFVNSTRSHTWASTAELSVITGISKSNIRTIRGILVNKQFIRRCDSPCSPEVQPSHYHLETPETDSMELELLGTPSTAPIKMVSGVILEAGTPPKSAFKMTPQGGAEDPSEGAFKMTPPIEVVDHLLITSKSSRPLNLTQGSDSGPKVLLGSDMRGAIEVGMGMGIGVGVLPAAMGAGKMEAESDVPTLGSDIWSKPKIKAGRTGVTKAGKFSPWLLVDYFGEKLREIKPFHHATDKDKGALGKQFRVWHEKSGWTAEMCTEAIDQFFVRAGVEDRLNDEGGLGIYFQFIGWTGHNQGSLQHTETAEDKYMTKLRLRKLAEFDSA